jgi:hypothetical protein
MPEAIVLEAGKWIGHITPGSHRHDSGPVQVEGLDKLKRRFYEVIGYLSLHNQVHYRDHHTLPRLDPWRVC